MKIVKLEAEAFKRLRAVEITPTGDMVTLTGRNGAGKSSVLDSIYAALAGKDAIPDKPIRRGEKTARISLDLGEIRVTRRFSEKGGTDVIVEADSGARFPSPQRMLNDLIGRLTFDPLAFSREKPEAQFETLRSLVPLEIDIDALAGLNKRDYEARTEINRQAKSLRAQADAIVLPADCPTEKRNTQEIIDRLQAAGGHNAAIERETGRRASHAAALDRKRATAKSRREEAEALRRRAQELYDSAATIDAECDNEHAEIAKLPPVGAPIDASTIRAELTSAEDTNLLAERHQKRAALIEDAEKAEKKSEAFTERMSARDKEKEDAFAKAAFPIDGLAFGDGEVVYNGLPLAQASTAEQIRVSMAIAMAMNPKLKIVCIREGEKLDPDGLALVAAMAKERDYQVWLEDCRSSDPLAIVIEDGAVRVADVAAEGALL